MRNKLLKRSLHFGILISLSLASFACSKKDKPENDAEVSEMSATCNADIFDCDCLKKKDKEADKMDETEVLSQSDVDRLTDLIENVENDCRLRVETNYR